MAGVERFELPTRAIYGNLGNPLLCQLEFCSQNKKLQSFDWSL